MWNLFRVLALLLASWGLCGCTSQQVKTAGKYAAIGTAQLAAEVFLGIEPPTPEELRAEQERAADEQRQHARRVDALTAEYEEFVRTKGNPAAPKADPVPVVIDAEHNLERIWSDLDPRKVGIRRERLVP